MLRAVVTKVSSKLAAKFLFVSFHIKQPLCEWYEVLFVTKSQHLFDRKSQTQPGGGWRFWSNAGHSNTERLSFMDFKLCGTVHSFLHVFYIFNGIKNVNIWIFLRGMGKRVGGQLTHVWDMEYLWTRVKIDNCFVICAGCTDGRFFFFFAVL